MFATNSRSIISQQLNLMMLAISLSSCMFINVVSQSVIASPARYNFLIDQMAPAGPHRIQLTEQGMKVESPKMSFGLQFRNTDSMVTLWSLKNHTYYILPYEKWLTSFRNLVSAVTFYSELVKPTKVTTQEKEHLTYHVYQYHVDAQSPSYWSSDIGHKEASQGLQDIDFTTVDVPSKQACLIMQRVYGTPPIPGFPYSLHRVGLKNSSLRTNKLISGHSKPISFFVPTSEYKKVPFSNQIIGPSVDDNMTKMMLPY